MVLFLNNNGKIALDFVTFIKNNVEYLVSIYLGSELSGVSLFELFIRLIHCLFLRYTIEI